MANEKTNDSSCFGSFMPQTTNVKADDAFRFGSSMPQTTNEKTNDTSCFGSFMPQTTNEKTNDTSCFGSFMPKTTDDNTGMPYPSPFMSAYLSTINNQYNKNYEKLKWKKSQKKSKTKFEYRLIAIISQTMFGDPKIEVRPLYGARKRKHIKMLNRLREKYQRGELKLKYPPMGVSKVVYAIDVQNVHNENLCHFE